LVARIENVDGELIGLHRTWLKCDDRGRWQRQDRAMLGRVKGGAVRLGPAADELLVAEGIETAASAMVATDLPAWAALSAGGLESLVLPPLPLARNVIILADNDPNGRGESAARSAGGRWLSEGRHPRIAMPKTVGSDWNDVLRGVAP
jgi:putative DNA primase/helicase